MGRTDDSSNPGRDRVSCLPANKVQHLVVEFDNEELAAHSVKDRVLVARASDVVTAPHSKLWQGNER